MKLTAVEICADPEGQALGLRRARFDHLAILNYDDRACWCLRRGVYASPRDIADIRQWRVPRKLEGCDLLAGSLSHKPAKSRDFAILESPAPVPAFMMLIPTLQPKAVMIDAAWHDGSINAGIRAMKRLKSLGYHVTCRIFHLAESAPSHDAFRIVIVGLRSPYDKYFSWRRTITTEGIRSDDAFAPEVARRIAKALTDGRVDRLCKSIGLELWPPG